MEYNFKEIESRWQQRWRENKTYRVETDPSRPKFYVLDMFPYPSGAGLHVGHPLATRLGHLFALQTPQGIQRPAPDGLRRVRSSGRAVRHPDGTAPGRDDRAQHRPLPRAARQDRVSFDWGREVRTCDPAYYKWTQWAFLKMFGSYYCYDKQQARPIEELTAAFEQGGTQGLNVAYTQELHFTAEEWRAMPEEEKERTLHNYRLAFRADTMVNWCPALGTVLANDEVHDGLSVRGGHPVEQKRMKQWPSAA